MARAHHLAARQLRFQQALLVLRHQLALLPVPTGSAAQWETWLARRGELLSEIARHDGPRLAAETADLLRDGASDPLSRWVGRLHARSLAILREVAAGEAQIEQAIDWELLALSRRLLAARGAATARDGYGLAPGPHPHLDRRG